MKPETASKIFLVGAIFNWIVACSLFFIPEVLLGLFGASPNPEQSLWVQQFSGLVFVFGIGYYWASRNFEANVQIIKMGVIAKSGVILIGLLNVMSGDISWQFMLPASGDLIFAILFVRALKAQASWKSGDLS